MVTKRLTIILLLCGLVGLMQCNKRSTSSDSPDDGVSSELTAAQRHVIESDNKFGLKLFREIVKEEPDSNVFISPLSVSMALGMTYNGANGETEEAMQRTLELSGLTLQEINESYKSLMELLRGLDPKVQFQIANSIWFPENMEPEEKFIDLCKEYFDALVRKLDFSDPDAVKIVNGWVYDNTNGKIETILDDIDDSMLMLLMNAIYFKGAWTYQFDEESTKNDLFTSPDGTKTPCRMMEQRGFYKYFSNDDFEAVDLPYGDGDFSMTIFLPNPKTDIDSLIAEFTPENLSYWLGCFSSDSGDIYIPKFKLEHDLGLNQALQSMGMEIAFSPLSADFTKMYKDGAVIDTVIHKTYVEVNEEGTEAAAVTVVVMIEISPGPSGFHMRVDRPFIFLIRENVSQTILFIGKVVEPRVE